MIPEKQTRRLAMVAIILAILSFLAPQILATLMISTVKVFHPDRTFIRALLFIGPLLAIAAIILASVVRRRIKSDPSLPGESIALSAQILGYILLAQTLLAYLGGLLFSYSMRDFH